MRFILFLVFIVSCGKKTGSQLTDLIDYYNAPSRLTPNTTSRLVDLPVTGISKFPVWIGSWLPYSQGGTSNTMIKYDQAMHGGSYPAWQWEQAQMAQLSSISWAGHCNGLAAASTMTQEPRHPVTYNGIVFTVDDIKALLVELWQGAESNMIGTRCQSPTPDAINGRMADPTCRDTNAGAFHVAVTNWLGIYNLPVIADIDPSEAVWNYPILGYQIRTQQVLTASDAMFWLDGVKSDVYAYNTLARNWQYVVMEVRLTSGTKVYEYILELDEIHNVIGGEWFRGSRQDHPDFLWRAVVPHPENPNLDPATIQEIARQGVL